MVVANVLTERRRSRGRALTGTEKGDIVIGAWAAKMASLTILRASSVQWYLRTADGTEGFSPRAIAVAVTVMPALMMYV